MPALEGLPGCQKSGRSKDPRPGIFSSGYQHFAIPVAQNTHVHICARGWECLFGSEYSCQSPLGQIQFGVVLGERLAMNSGGSTNNKEANRLWRSNYRGQGMYLSAKC